jgi:acyl dehydratase
MRNQARGHVPSSWVATGPVCAEDLGVGQELLLCSQAAPEQGVIESASARDRQHFHVDHFRVDPEAAWESHFNGLIAGGAYTYDLPPVGTQAQSHGWKVIAGREPRRERFLHPVRPNDVLTARFRIEPIGTGQVRKGVAGVLRSAGQPARKTGPQPRGGLLAPHSFRRAAGQPRAAMSVRRGSR